MTEPPGQTPEEMKASERTKIEAALDDVERDVNAVNNDSTDLQVTAANDALAALQKAIGDATALSDSEKSPYRSLHGKYMEELTAKENARTKHQNIQEETKMDNRREANNAISRPWETTISTYKVPGTIGRLDNLLGTTQTGTTPLYGDNVEVKNANGATTIAVDTKDGIPIPSSSGPDLDGWTTSRFTESPTSRGVVATNLGNPTSRTIHQSYTKFFYTDGDAAATPNTSAIAGVTPVATTGVLDIASAARFRNSDFGGSRPGPLTTVTPRDITFLGVSGTLTCPTASTTPCKVQEEGDGIFSFSSDVTFTPKLAEGASLSDLQVRRIIMPTPQTEYITYGYWLNTSGSGTSLKHTIDAYSRSDGGSSGHSLGGLRGSSTYTGNALGIYFARTGTNDKPALHNGEFVADVNLTAQFGDTTGKLAARDQWRLTGNVKGFRSTNNNAHDAVIGQWDLKLQADIGEFDASSGTGRRNLVTGVMNPGSIQEIVTHSAITNGGGSKIGTWLADFNHPGQAGGTDGVAATSPEAHPQSIIGEFNGFFTNGSVVGAFGATKDN